MSASDFRGFSSPLQKELADLRRGNHPACFGVLKAFVDSGESGFVLFLEGRNWFVELGMLASRHKEMLKAIQQQYNKDE